MKRIMAVLIVGISVLAFNSCILDPKEKENTPGPPASPYKALDEERDNVLFNLEKSYKERNIDRYDELLDAGFIFHFSAADFKNGWVTVEDWDRAAEIGSALNMFDPNYQGPREPVSNIDLTLTYAEGDDRWIQVTPDDQEKYADETWYEKTVRYNLTVQSGDISFVGDNLQASFLVRWAEVEGVGFWRIIAWRDDTRSSLCQRSAGASDSAAGISETTWGNIKAYYSP